MDESKKWERYTRSNIILRCGVESSPKELDVTWNFTTACTVAVGNFVDPICMYDSKSPVDGGRRWTSQPRMVQVDDEAQVFERYPNECRTCPLLFSKCSVQVEKSRIERAWTYLNYVQWMKPMSAYATLPTREIWQKTFLTPIFRVLWCLYPPRYTIRALRVPNEIASALPS